MSTARKKAQTSSTFPADHVPVLRVAGDHPHVGARVRVSTYAWCGLCGDSVSTVRVTDRAVDPTAHVASCLNARYDAWWFAGSARENLAQESKVAGALRKLVPGQLYRTDKLLSPRGPAELEPSALKALKAAPRSAVELLLDRLADLPAEPAGLPTAPANAQPEADIALLRELALGDDDAAAGTALAVLPYLGQPRWCYDPAADLDPATRELWRSLTAGGVSPDAAAASLGPVQAVLLARRSAVMEALHATLLDSRPARLSLALQAFLRAAGHMLLHTENPWFTRLDWAPVRQNLLGHAEAQLDADAGAAASGVTEELRRWIDVLGCTDVARAVRIAARLQAVNPDLAADLMVKLVPHSPAPEGVHAMIEWLDTRGDTERGELGALAVTWHPDALSWLLSAVSGSSRNEALRCLGQYRRVLSEAAVAHGDPEPDLDGEPSPAQVLRLQAAWVAGRARGLSPLAAILRHPSWDGRASEARWALWMQTGEMLDRLPWIGPDGGPVEFDPASYAARVPLIVPRTDLDQVRSRFDPEHVACHQQAAAALARMTPERLGTLLARALGRPESDGGGGDRAAAVAWMVLAILDPVPNGCQVEKGQGKGDLCALRKFDDYTATDYLLVEELARVQPRHVPAAKLGAGGAADDLRQLRRFPVVEKQVRAIPVALALRTLEAWLAAGLAPAHGDADRLRVVLGLMELSTGGMGLPQNGATSWVRRLARHLGGQLPIADLPAAGLLASLEGDELEILIRALCVAQIDYGAAQEDPESYSYPVHTQLCDPELGAELEQRLAVAPELPVKSLFRRPHRDRRGLASCLAGMVESAAGGAAADAGAASSDAAASPSASGSGSVTAAGLEDTDTVAVLVAGRAIPLSGVSLDQARRVLSVVESWAARLGERFACVAAGADARYTAEIDAPLVIGLEIDSISADEGPSDPLPIEQLRARLEAAHQLPGTFWHELALALPDEARRAATGSRLGVHLVGAGPLSTAILAFGQLEDDADDGGRAHLGPGYEPEPALERRARHRRAHQRHPPHRAR
jgi:hypothetical protein